MWRAKYIQETCSIKIDFLIRVSYVTTTVSILTPVYNAGKLIKETIKSVQSQTFKNWEWHLVDDCSTDDSVEIIQEFAKSDSRIHLWQNEKNSGAAYSRNQGLKHSVGNYIAYIDADDIWTQDKLAKQLRFMREKDVAFSCTSYRVISEDGESLNKDIHMLPIADYKGFLTHNLLQTVGIMIDLSKVDKKYCQMPDLRRRQDAATWLQILKAGYYCYGLNEVLAEYRRTKGSLSSNKVKAVKGIWYLYRKVEQLKLPFAVYCFVRYAGYATWKRVYR